MCISPITVVHKRLGVKKAYTVPCGKCSECLKKKMTSWGIRAYRETLFSSTPTRFVTLTYSNRCIPTTLRGNYTLCRDDVTKFLKSFRQYLFYHYNAVIRYFCSCEYGSRTCRPHYHFLFHDIPSTLTNSELRDIIHSLWHRCDIIDVQFCKNSSSCFYVGKYQGKLSNYDKDDPEMIAPYKRASIGYGGTFTDAEKSYYLAKDKPANTVNQFLFQFLRYFECHRPLKDGSFVNVRFPDYIADKLYGEVLLRRLKAFFKFLYERKYYVNTNFADYMLSGGYYSLNMFDKYLLSPRIRGIFDRAISSGDYTEIFDIYRIWDIYNDEYCYRYRDDFSENERLREYNKYDVF